MTYRQAVFFTHHLSYVTMCVVESRSSGICMLRERERERERERAEMVNARFIQKNIEKDFKKTTRRRIYIRQKTENFKEKERKKNRDVLNFAEYPPSPHSKDGQDHMDKYLDTSTKILSQEMLTFFNMKVLALTFENY